MRRLAAAGAVVLLVLVVAITPLSTALASGYFQLWIPTEWMGPSTQVVLFDDTGLVRAFVASKPRSLDQGVEPTSGPTQRLTVTWLGGCSDGVIRIHFYPRSGGFGLDERTERNGCQFLNGVPRSFALLLYAPIDASTVVLTGTDVRTNE